MAEVEREELQARIEELEQVLKEIADSSTDPTAMLLARGILADRWLEIEESD